MPLVVTKGSLWYTLRYVWIFFIALQCETIKRRVRFFYTGSLTCKTTASKAGSLYEKQFFVTVFKILFDETGAVNDELPIFSAYFYSSAFGYS